MNRIDRGFAMKRNTGDGWDLIATLYMALSVFART